MDNKSLKDGLGDLFSLRQRDRSTAGDGSLMQTMVLSTGYPVDYGTGGVIQHCGKSGALAAGMAAASPIYAFQWPASLYALIRRVRLSAWTTGVAFSAGLATFDLYVARAFTAQYTGGTIANLIGGGGQLRTSMTASQANIMYATTAPLTVGTRTLDPDPLHSVTVAAPIAANAPFFAAGPVTIFEKLVDAHPLMLVANEGFVLRATVPATGTWSFAVTTEWDEVTVY
jgi:hypothetical protein